MYDEQLNMNSKRFLFDASLRRSPSSERRSFSDKWSETSDWSCWFYATSLYNYTNRLIRIYPNWLCLKN